jgi:biopolymer transport protein TolR
MSFSMAGGGARGPEINVTPLIDVLLTLIIVFMVVVSMDKEQGETAQIPQPDQKQTQNIAQPRTVVIQVVWTKTNEDQPPSVKINQENVRWEDLEPRLAKIYLTRAEKVVFVRGDADVNFQYVADVIDVAHHAGVQRVGLLTMGYAVENKDAFGERCGLPVN